MAYYLFCEKNYFYWIYTRVGQKVMAGILFSDAVATLLWLQFMGYVDEDN